VTTECLQSGDQAPFALRLFIKEIACRIPSLSAQNLVAIDGQRLMC